MKIRKLFLVLVMTGMTLLSSCDLFSSSFSEGTGPGFYKMQATKISQKQYNEASGSFSLESVGNQKILVVPVIFGNYSYTNAQKDVIHGQLEDVFFGDKENTSWESVASYYETSSYGKLHLSGEVTDFYTPSMTSKQFINRTRSSGDYYEYFEPSWILAEDSVSFIKENESRNLKEYDKDRDGFIDALWIVYINPNYRNYDYKDSKAQDQFWAYTYWAYGNYNKGDDDSPVAMTYAFASYDFMYEGYGSEGIDAHTYIHETGHILGLDDYYTYDSDSDYNPTGGLDMMDENILDHNAYSKYLLGWTHPIYVDGTRSEFEININPFVSTGDFILLNNTWNKSAYDEYLAIEFYTPSSLNEADSREGGYPGNSIRGFSVPGIKIYHVDSRLGKFDKNDNFVSYADSVITDSQHYVEIAMSNSRKFSVKPDYKLIHLLEKNGTNTFKFGDRADNGTLFREGSVFNPESTHQYMFRYKNRFNDFSLIGYTMEVTRIYNDVATLKFTRLG